MVLGLTQDGIPFPFYKIKAQRKSAEAPRVSIPKNEPPKNKSLVS